jgi:thioredoxin/glutathione reductase (selenoprotein)
MNSRIFGSSFTQVFRSTRFRSKLSQLAPRYYHTNDYDVQTEINHKFDYDLVCIGGGSGGLATVKRAHFELKEHQRTTKIAIIDYRENPNNINTYPDRPKLNWKWGLGGTCTNVGCIPKKLMHLAAQNGEYIKHDAIEFGWNFKEPVTHDWKTLVNNVQNHIRSIHFGYRVDMTQNEIKYINARAKFIDKHTIEIIDAKGVKSQISSRRFVIAVGGMPIYPEIQGAKEYGITSDELFALIDPPGKTLVVGASYIALESAGFLTGLGHDVTVMMRSIPLRGFDQECAAKVVDFMHKRGTKFIRSGIPTSITKTGDRTYKVEYSKGDEKKSEEFNTVLFAIGRRSVAKELCLEDIGVKLNYEKGGKIVVNEYEQTDVPHIYAVGDCIDRGIELTPVAIRAGSLLAKRIYSDFPAQQDKRLLMDYINVPTTVFTPLEYSSCGLSEEAAVSKYGEHNVEVYHMAFTPLEHSFAHRDENQAYMKMICHSKDVERVVGFHYCGPYAGEIMQSAAVAIRLGATKYDFDSTVGIHPTTAEEMTKLNISKSSGLVAEKKGC